MGSILGIIIIAIGLVILSYFAFPETQKFFSNLPAKFLAVLSPFFTEIPKEASSVPTSTEAPPSGKLSPEIIKQMEPQKYAEEAKWGEGITHLARRALKEYLEDNPQSFNVTPEHKVYIEDELAKKMGGNWLQLGETVEFSDDLLKEAIQKAETLTPQQLENLTQYSHLVPSLNY